MTDMERIKEYNRSIRDVPAATDFAVMSIAKEYYGIDVKDIS